MIENYIFLRKDCIPRAMQNIFGEDRLLELMMNPELCLDPAVSQAIRDAAVEVPDAEAFKLCKKNKDALYKTPSADNWFWGWAYGRVGAVQLVNVNPNVPWTIQVVNGIYEEIVYFEPPTKSNYMKPTAGNKTN